MALSHEASPKRKYSGEEIEAAKRRCNDVALGPTLVINSSAGQHTVHKALICRRSGLIKALVESRLTPDALVTVHAVDPQLFRLYISFIYAGPFATLDKHAKIHYIAHSTSTFSRCSENESMLCTYARMWRLGEFLADHAFMNEAMDRLLETPSPTDLIAFMSRNGASEIVAYKDTEDAGCGLWRWIVDCVAFGIKESDLGMLWEWAKDRQDFVTAVLRMLVRYRSGQLKAPTMADRGLYMEGQSIED